MLWLFGCENMRKQGPKTMVMETVVMHLERKSSSSELFGEVVGHCKRLQNLSKTSCFYQATLLNMFNSF